MKNKLMKALAMVMVVGSVLTGCGGPAKPSGTYETYDLSFNFSDKTVIVTEGSTSVKCDYEIDSDGNITFELEGDTLTCTYDEEHDVIYFWGEMYTKE